MEKTPLHKQLQPWPTRQQNLKGSNMLQLCFSTSPCRQVSKAQGHTPRGEKAPRLGREKWKCRRAAPEGQEILLGHISGPRRMQEQTTTSQQLPETSRSLSGQYNISEVGQNLYPPSMIQESLHRPENMGCLSMANANPGMEAPAVGL